MSAKFKKKDIGQDILELHSQGLSGSQIAERLGCSRSAVSYHCGLGKKLPPKICRTCSAEMPSRRLYDDCHTCKMEKDQGQTLLCKKCGERKDKIDFPVHNYSVPMPDGTFRKHHKQRRSCFGCLRAKRIESDSKHPPDELAAKRRIASIKCRLKKYGLTIDQAFKILDQQNHTCKICKVKISFDQSDGFSRACIDHCHSTMKVRGILCGNCNTAIGMLGDDITVIQSAASYLQGD